MKLALTFIMSLHGLIHIMGFVKAFEWSEVKELTLPISKPLGIVWGIAFLLFGIAALLYHFKNNSWWWVSLIAVFISQILIILFWQDAKFGTIANVIILLASIAGFGNWQFENTFRKDVGLGLQRTGIFDNQIITKQDIQHLPAPVQKYLQYVGAIGKPKVNNMRVSFNGEMRGKDQNWFKFTSQQYNFYDDWERLFFMKAKINSLPTNGYHVYKGSQAAMKIKLLSLFPVVDISNDDLFKAETVTLFNDMCLLAPATLIDRRIEWETINDRTVKANFRNKATTISATLFFNQKNQLINFVSDDRFDISDNKQYQFSTPVSDYQNFNGYNLMTVGKAIWHYPEGPFTYGKFYLKNVKYNVID